ncbi:hypothetical protein [Desulfobotulus alkaliphilus]|nr:hypothetical protein [Desulfobotulus alkaliphilus]
MTVTMGQGGCLLDISDKMSEDSRTSARRAGAVARAAGEMSQTISNIASMRPRER